MLWLCNSEADILPFSYKWLKQGKKKLWSHFLQQFKFSSVERHKGHLISCTNPYHCTKVLLFSHTVIQECCNYFQSLSFHQNFWRIASKAELAFKSIALSFRLCFTSPFFLLLIISVTDNKSWGNTKCKGFEELMIHLLCRGDMSIKRSTKSGLPLVYYLLAFAIPTFLLFSSVIFPLHPSWSSRRNCKTNTTLPYQLFLQH